MTPGGDYGKKELSPAMSNRFTEIWVPAIPNFDDVLQIVRSKLKLEHAPFAGAIVSFSQWFNDKYNTSVSSSISIRDTLALDPFINKSITMIGSLASSMVQLWCSSTRSGQLQLACSL
ncbi:hypothetical protein NX059_012280 [Plenodomus lindquistii]|nr:hypothetical protein NX059_012280 [Plenodomus lindquistii]